MENQKAGFDRNQLIGLLLIVTITVGFGWWQSTYMPEVEDAPPKEVVEEGASTQGVNAEATSVTEHIENLLAMRQRPEEGSVFALVDEETRFLSALPIDVELMSVFGGEMTLRGLAKHPSVFRCLAAVLDQSLGAFVIDADQCFSQGLLER